MANLAVVPVAADGSFCIYAQSAVDLVVDIQGSLVPATDSRLANRFTPVAPIRLLDTRIAG